MLCNICGKNPATVHLTEIINEQMNELHLCEECARQKSAQMEQQFGLNDLLAGMVESDKPARESAAQVSLKCQNCGLTYQDFKKIGRFGCSECYTSFKKYLIPLLKRIHGSNKHTGKTPFGVVIKQEAKPKEVLAPATSSLEELRVLLTKAIEAEAFEDAARLRDQIKELEKA